MAFGLGLICLNHTNHRLIDCQIQNPYLKYLGAFNIKPTTFTKLL